MEKQPPLMLPAWTLMARGYRPCLQAASSCSTLGAAALRACKMASERHQNGWSTRVRSLQFTLLHASAPAHLVRKNTTIRDTAVIAKNFSRSLHNRKRPQGTHAQLEGALSHRNTRCCGVGSP